MPNPTPEVSDREERLDLVLAAYLRAAETGPAPPRDELLRRHPDLADDLADFFANEDRLGSFAAPLRATAPSGMPASIGNYDVLGEIGRGGMGIIYKARQRGLNRVVALKMIRTSEWTTQADLRRFHAEAEAVAHLDHPHIVPVYEVGEHQGQPYFSMKLMEGGSLADLVLRPLASDRGGLARNGARLVAQVARAVHYAHQRGILHRDLKPANVLLDADGRPHVSDFGLAKRVVSEPLADVTPPLGTGLSSTRDMPPEVSLATDDVVTRPGAIVGTPSYIAPEQASGRPGMVSTASDVYSLGAILYEVLTGRPPFRGATPLETVLQVREREPVRPRTLRPQVHRDLETICLKCLEKEPARRYASAAALADDLERFLAGEPIHARPVGKAERLARWCRRNPALAVATGLAAACLVCLAVGASLFALRERSHLAELDRANADLRRQMLEADRSARDAAEQRDRAEASFRLAHGALRDYCVNLSEGRFSQTPGMQPARKELLETGLKYYQEFAKQRANDPKLKAELADTHYRIAIITSVVGSQAEALAAYRRSADLYEELLREEPTNTAVRAGLARDHLNTGAIQEMAVNAQAALASYRKARSLLQELVAAVPDNPSYQRLLAMTHMDMGNVYRVTGQYTEAQAAYDQALALYERLARSRPDSAEGRRDLAVLRVNLGVLQSFTGQGDEGLRSYQLALAEQERLARERPRDQKLQSDLALNYRRVGSRLCLKGQVADGLVILRRARDGFEKLVAANPDVLEHQVDLAICKRLIGKSLRGPGQVDEARALIREAGTTLDKLTRRQPGVARWEGELAACYFERGVLLADCGDRAGALKAYRRAADLGGKLVEAHPDNLDFRHSQGLNLNSLAVILKNLGRLDEALGSLREGVEQDRVAVARAPQAVRYHQALVHHYSTLADTLKKAGRRPEAVRTLREAGALLEPFARAYPQDLTWQADLSWIYYATGQALEANGEKAEGVRFHQRAREMREKLVQARPEERRYRLSLSVSLNNLGLLLGDLGRREEGIAALRAGVEQARELFRRSSADADSRRILNNNLGALAQLLRAVGRPDEAAALTRERLPLWPANGPELYGVARDLALAADKGAASGDEALEVLRQAVAAGFHDAARLQKDSALDPLRRRADFQKLLAQVGKGDGPQRHRDPEKRRSDSERK